LPMSMARSSSGMLTISRIAYQREGGDGSRQRGQSVIRLLCRLRINSISSETRRTRRWEFCTATVTYPESGKAVQWPHRSWNILHWRLGVN